MIKGEHIVSMGTEEHSPCLPNSLEGLTEMTTICYFCSSPSSAWKHMFTPEVPSKLQSLVLFERHGVPEGSPLGTQSSVMGSIYEPLLICFGRVV